MADRPRLWLNSPTMQTSGGFPALNSRLTPQRPVKPASNLNATNRTVQKATPNPVKTKRRNQLTPQAPKVTSNLGNLASLAANALRVR